jgi:hypothetical protein
MKEQQGEMKMKPSFKHAVKNTRGIDRKEDLVYCEYNQGELIITRHLPKRPLYDSNRNFGTICSNLRHLYGTLSAEYKNDLSSYTLMYRSIMYDSHKIALSAYSIFTKMMWALKKQYPKIDLKILTREEILKNEYPVSSIAEAMGKGLVMVIKEAEMLNHKM